MSLNDYRTIWNRKPALRTIYADFYERIAEHCVPTSARDRRRDRQPEAAASDRDDNRRPICALARLCCGRPPSAIRRGTLATIVMVDVLHHLEHPATFFQEAERVLQSGGRIVMVEPAITWGSTLFYRVFHQEHVRTSANPLTDRSIP
jgi:SAM-dependent methyltransferase